jgi:hypothetical protein
MILSKSRNYVFFYLYAEVLGPNFFRVRLFATLSTDLNQHQILCFFVHMLVFFGRGGNSCDHNSTSYNVEAKRTRNYSLTKNLIPASCYICVVEEKV